MSYSDKPEGFRFTMDCETGIVELVADHFEIEPADVPSIFVAAALAHANFFESVEVDSPLPVGERVHVDVVRLNGKYTAEFCGDEGYFPSIGMALATFVEFCSTIEDIMLEAADSEAEGEVLGPLDTARGWQAPREDIEA
jgi:hypothetical protein